MIQIVFDFRSEHSFGLIFKIFDLYRICNYPCPKFILAEQSDSLTPHSPLCTPNLQFSVTY